MIYNFYRSLSLRHRSFLFQSDCLRVTFKRQLINFLSAHFAKISVPPRTHKPPNEPAFHSSGRAVKILCNPMAWVDRGRVSQTVKPVRDSKIFHLKEFYFITNFAGRITD
jgi:hypothetical protein